MQTASACRRRYRAGRIAAAVGALLPAQVLAGGNVPTLFGMPYYSQGFAEGFAQVIAVIVFCVGLARYAKRPGLAMWKAAAKLTLVVVLVWEAVFNLDIMMRSLWVHHRCRTEGGLHVYRTAEVAGFAGTTSISTWASEGFEFVELYDPRYGESLPIVRGVMENGQATWHRVHEYLSQYEYVTLGKWFRAARVQRTRYQVRHRETREVLGELVGFRVYAGFFDGAILSLLPGAWSPWICGEEIPAAKTRFAPAPRARYYGSTDVIRATLKPPSRKGLSE